MDIYFADPSEVPLPPDDVRIRNLSVETLPEGKRVRVKLELDPFQRKPNVDLVILDKNGREIASTSIIESITRTIEVIMHIPSGLHSTSYQLQARLYFFRDNQEMENQEFVLDRWDVDSAQAEFATE